MLVNGIASPTALQTMLLNQKVKETPAIAEHNALHAPKAVDAEAKFTELMEMSPEERMFTLWLKQHDVTKEEFEAMTPEEQQALMEQFRQEVEQRVREKVERGEAVVDILA